MLGPIAIPYSSENMLLYYTNKNQKTTGEFKQGVRSGYVLL
jgi:hypothetical protein